MKTIWASFNRFEIEIPQYIVDSVPQSGPADYAIRNARTDFFVLEQLAKIDPDKLKAELKEYGAWDEIQLSNHSDNLDRILWIAVGNIQDGNCPLDEEDDSND